jgi:ABC-type Fe3+-hydroxamate transport system substrate-binding protein
VKASRPYIDQLGNAVALAKPAKRIISLVPSQTELLADLGLEHEVVGITKFCVHPAAWQKAKTKVGGTKKFNLDIIRSLKPDLILGNKEENYPEGIEQVRRIAPVWMSDIVTLDDALNMITSVGEMTGTEDQANEMVTALQKGFHSLIRLPSRRVLYLIWQNPWMGVAEGTFIHSMLTLSGLQNCLEGRNRYPELSTEEIKILSPDYIFLSTEPYPFTEPRKEKIQLLFPNSKVLLVDGEMFSWYGSRLLQFWDYLNTVNQQLQ